MNLAFKERGADYLLAMKEEHGNVGPVIIRKGEDPGVVTLDVPYQLITILLKIYPLIKKGKIAVICRRCDEKALNELIKRGLIENDRIVRIGLACQDEQIAECRCQDPVPSVIDFGDAHAAIEADEIASDIIAATIEKRQNFWIRQFRKCIKCYACSANCPVCVCDECILEECTFVPERGIPPGLAFHLIRAFHLADKCIECGECERSCPANIPLLSLRKLTRTDMKDLFGYSPGDTDKISPLLTTLDGEPLEDGSDGY